MLFVAVTGCMSDSLETTQEALTSPTRERTQATIACIQLCAEDSIACNYYPGDCSAQCTNNLAGLADFCMAPARDWYECKRTVYPFCIDPGEATRYGCYVEYDAFIHCILGW